MRALGME
jgi:hypothetical protein